MLRRMLLAATVVVVCGALPAIASATTLSVNAIGSGGQFYTDSGVTLAAGQHVVVTASGTWDACGGACPTDANGIPGNSDPNLTDPAAAGGALIGSLDGGATWFWIGIGPSTVTGPGTLLLAANDYPADACSWCYSDNAGAVQVTIRPPAPVTADQCKKDGWKSYGLFKNQGDCVSYVATAGKNKPAGV